MYLTIMYCLGIGFNGFNESMENETVMVKLEQAVGLHCGYVDTPVPNPDVTWLKDQETITIGSDPRYRLLEKGELVIYDLKMSDIWNNDNNELFQYRCRVNNVRIVENATAPFFYTLFANESGELHKVEDGKLL